VNDKLLRAVSEPFFEKMGELGDAAYVLFAAPLDKTASYRGGSRFAPQAIRLASQYMESYSVRSSLDWEDLNLIDIGDATRMTTVEGAVADIQAIVEEINELGKTPVMIGGEHTITFGAIRALKPQAVVVFDAHLDLRNELFNEKLCHATYLRRAHEELRFKLVVIAARALSREEIDYAESNEIIILTALDVKRKGINYTVEEVKKALHGVDSVYLSVDMDAIDPSEAPAVGNPSPEGITTTQLLDIVNGFVDRRIIGVDINEVSPAYDSGNTAVQSAYLLLEILYSIEAARRSLS
jgi:agmatinase